MVCPLGHPVDIEDPASVGYADMKDEEGAEVRFYWCRRCKVMFFFDPGWDKP